MRSRALLSFFATLCCAMASEQTCRKVPFTLLGSGGVGAALLKAIVGARELHDTSYGLRFCAKAVCDSSAVAKGTGGELSDQAIAAILEHKAGGGKLADLVLSGVTITAKPADASTSDFLTDLQNDGGMLVDCTATEDTIPALLATAAVGGRVVSANKKPFSSDYSAFKALVRRPAAPGTIRFESSVGAGLPVIAALQRTIAAADPVSSISGSFSGTLGYVMSGLQVKPAQARTPSPLTTHHSVPQRLLRSGTTHGCSLCRLRLQPLSPMVAASVTFGCSLHRLWLQPLSHMVAAAVIYGCRRGGPFRRWCSPQRASASLSLTRATTWAVSTSRARRSSSRVAWVCGSSSTR